MVIKFRIKHASYTSYSKDGLAYFSVCNFAISLYLSLFFLTLRSNASSKLGISNSNDIEFRTKISQFE